VYSINSLKMQVVQDVEQLPVLLVHGFQAHGGGVAPGDERHGGSLAFRRVTAS
jgi:hypothetical protein